MADYKREYPSSGGSFECTHLRYWLSSISPQYKGNIDFDFTDTLRIQFFFHKDSLYPVWLNATQWYYGRLNKCEMFTDRQTDKRMDRRKTGVQKSSLEHLVQMCEIVSYDPHMWFQCLKKMYSKSMSM